MEYQKWLLSQQRGELSVKREHHQVKSDQAATVGLEKKKESEQGETSQIEGRTEQRIIQAVSYTHLTLPTILLV